MLKELSKDYKIMIVTSNLSRVIKKALKDNNINEIEDVVGSDRERSKVKKLEIIKKNNPKSKIYYVGDTTGDIYEGREAGVKTVATTWGFHSRDKLERSKPDYIVDAPEDIFKILDN